MKYIGISIILMVVSAGAYYSSQTTIKVVNEDIYEDNHLHIESDGELQAHLPVINTNNQLPSTLINSSLKGTHIDGAYPVDQDGNLLLSISIKQRFEYFLSLMGEYSLEEILGFISEDIDTNLQEPALSQARELLNNYIDYKYALAELEKTLASAEGYEISDLSRFRMQLEQLRDVRRSHLSSDAVNAFFGFDEVYDDFMLNTLEVQNNQQLSLEEKQEQLKALQQSLPEDIREQREQTQKISDIYLLTESMKQEGASSEEIQSVRQQAHGIEAAERLQALDESRHQWQSRVDSYLLRKSVIESDDTLTSEEKSLAINDIKEESFSSQERMRLKAFELMAQE